MAALHGVKKYGGRCSPADLAAAAEDELYLFINRAHDRTDVLRHVYS